MCDCRPMLFLVLLGVGVCVISSCVPEARWNDNDEDDLLLSSSAGPSFIEKSELIFLGRVIDKNAVGHWAGLTVLPTKCYKGGRIEERIRVTTLDLGRHSWWGEPYADDLNVGEEYLFLVRLHTSLSAECKSPVYGPVTVLDKAEAAPLEEMRFKRARFMKVLAVHKVTKGDTLSGLMKEYYGDVKLAHKVAGINQIKDKDVIIDGSYIIFPELDYFREDSDGN